MRQGKSEGELCHGYEVVHSPGPDDTPIRGGRRIIKPEAKVVRRIFEDFTAGRSPRTIARALDRNCIPGRRNRAWGPSTRYGNWRRGTGRNGVRAERARRPVYLLSGLLKCGACGGGMSKTSTHHHGCSNVRSRGTCDNLIVHARTLVSTPRNA